MFVSNSMIRKVITTTPETDVCSARERMRQHGIRHLPVVNADGRLLGIVTDRDVRSAMPSSVLCDEKRDALHPDLNRLRVRDIMTVDPVTVQPMHTIEDALLLFREHKVGAFPVVNEARHLCGILSVRDLLRAFVTVLGIGEPGCLLCILVEDRVGQLKKIVDAITALNVSFGSVLVARHWEPDKRAVFPYLLTQNVSRVKRALREQGFDLLDPMQWCMGEAAEPDGHDTSGQGDTG